MAGARRGVLRRRRLPGRCRRQAGAEADPRSHQLPPARRHGRRAARRRCWRSWRGPWPSTSPCRRTSASWPARRWPRTQVPAGTRLVMEKPFGSGEESARHLNETLAGPGPGGPHPPGGPLPGQGDGAEHPGPALRQHLPGAGLEPGAHRKGGDHLRRGPRPGGPRPLLRRRRRPPRHDPEPPAADHGADGDRTAGLGGRTRPPRRRGHRAAGQQHQGARTAKSTRRARYTAGSIDGRKVPDYAKEEGVDAARGTETLAEVQVEIDNWRWQGVPVHPALRQGAGRQSARKPW